MIYEIVIPSEVGSFVQETQLSGQTWRLLLRWNVREEFWYLTVSDLDGVVICSRKLVPGGLLLRQTVGTRPPGDLIFDEEIYYDDLG